MELPLANCATEEYGLPAILSYERVADLRQCLIPGILILSDMWIKAKNVGRAGTWRLA